jgi:nitroreductase
VQSGPASRVAGTTSACRSRRQSCNPSGRAGATGRDADRCRRHRRGRLGCWALARAAARDQDAAGYRRAFIDAGRIGERAYLIAKMFGLSACGIGALFDAGASALTGRDAADHWPVHLVAIGRRA